MRVLFSFLKNRLGMSVSLARLTREHKALLADPPPHIRLLTTTFNDKMWELEVGGMGPFTLWLSS
jgi:hypothetical protein